MISRLDLVATIRGAVPQSSLPQANGSRGLAVEGWLGESRREGVALPRNVRHSATLSHDVASADAHRNTEGETSVKPRRAKVWEFLGGNGRGKGLQCVHVNPTDTTGRVNVNTTDATAGATTLLLPAQNTHTLQDPACAKESRCQNAQDPKKVPRNQNSLRGPNKAGLVHNNAGVTIRTARDTTAANISSAAFPPTSSRPILEPISEAIVVNCRCLSCRGGHGSSSLHDADARSCKHNNVCWSPELCGACRLGHHIDPRVDTQRRYGARAHAGSRLSFSNCIG